MMRADHLTVTIDDHGTDQPVTFTDAEYTITRDHVIVNAAGLRRSFARFYVVGTEAHRDHAA